MIRGLFLCAFFFISFHCEVNGDEIKIAVFKTSARLDDEPGMYSYNTRSNYFSPRDWQKSLTKDLAKSRRGLLVYVTSTVFMYKFLNAREPRRSLKRIITEAFEGEHVIAFVALYSQMELGIEDFIDIDNFIGNLESSLEIDPKSNRLRVVGLDDMAGRYYRNWNAVKHDRNEVLVAQKLQDSLMPERKVNIYNTIISKSFQSCPEATMVVYGNKTNVPQIVRTDKVEFGKYRPQNWMSLFNEIGLPPNENHNILVFVISAKLVTQVSENKQTIDFLRKLFEKTWPNENINICFLSSGLKDETDSFVSLDNFIINTFWKNMKIDVHSGHLRVIGIGSMDGRYVSNWKVGQSEVEVAVAQKIQEELLSESTNILQNIKSRSFSFSRSSSRSGGVTLAPIFQH